MGVRNLPGAFLLVLGAYAALLCVRLDRVPLINPDEAAYTEPALTLITSGRFAAPMYEGLFGIDHRWYFLWPGYAVLAAIPYAVAGVELVGVRLMSGAFGALLLVATWLLASAVHGSGLRSASERFLAATAALVAVHPVVFSLSRFGRPEIAVTACAVLSSACAARAGARPPALRRRWDFAAGAAGALAFLMHQYGGFALLSLGAGYAADSRRTAPDRIRALGIASGGAAVVLLPWMLWIASGWPLFTAQLGVQLEYQRWRYPDVTAVRSVVNDFPARYLLNLQDPPRDRSPWLALPEHLLGPSFFAPQPATVRGALRRAAAVPYYWMATAGAPLARWLAAAALVSAVVATVVALSRRDSAAVRWLLVPLLTWLVCLAPIPNKWDGYTGPVAVYAVLAVTHVLRTAPVRPAAVFLGGLLTTAALVWTVSAASQLAAPPTPYATYVQRLRQSVPPGETVACAMREWFAFAGRNPTFTIEFRSLQPFGGALLETIAARRPRYLVLPREGPAEAPRYFFVDPEARDFYRFVATSTSLVDVLADPWLGTLEIREVRSWPPSNRP